MANRLYKRTYRVDSPDIQGEGSFVEFKRLTFEEMKPVLAAKEHQSWERVKASVVTWNWVDDAGEPLPNPHEHPEVLETLISEEVLFLMRASTQGPDREEEKN